MHCPFLSLSVFSAGCDALFRLFSPAALRVARPNPGNGNNVRNVSSAGSQDNNNAWNSNGVVPVAYTNMSTNFSEKLNLILTFVENISAPVIILDRVKKCFNFGRKIDFVFTTGINLC